MADRQTREVGKSAPALPEKFGSAFDTRSYHTEQSLQRKDPPSSARPRFTETAVRNLLKSLSESFEIRK
jgi:hypothetical protein